jgi:hypothetical protein
MDMLTHIFSSFLPGVFTVLRTYMLVTTVMGNYRPINRYVDTHIFTEVTNIYVLNTVNTTCRKCENMCVNISINRSIVTHYRGYKHIRP